MEASRREIEIKLPFESAEAAKRAVDGLGARPAGARTFEDNVLFDRDGSPLESEDKLLRLRRSGGRAWLTFKGPAGVSGPHRVRVEDESAVRDPDAVEHILRGVGFVPTYRYQKYRTMYRLGRLLVCVDETPLGCFVELEGPPSAIDDAARRLGFSPERYLRESYRQLHEEAIAEGRFRGRDLVFQGTTTTP